MTLEQIQYVLEIAKQGSISKAADVLYVSQPCLSTAIKNLEKELRIIIFERNSKGIRLTSAGKLFIQSCEYVLQHVNFMHEIYKIVGDENVLTELKIMAAFHSPINEAIISKFLEQLDSEQFVVTWKTAKRSQVITALDDKNCHIGIIGFCEEEKALVKNQLKLKNLQFQPIIQTDCYFLIGHKNPLFQAEIISLKDCDTYPYLTFDTSELYDTFSQMTLLKKCNVLEVSSAEEFLQIIANTTCFGIATPILAPNYLEQKFKHKIKLIPMKETMRYLLGFVSPKNTELPYQLENFIQLYKDEVQKIIPI